MSGSGKPLGSTDFQDLPINMANMDKIANSNEAEVTNRATPDGNIKTLTVKGMQDLFAMTPINLPSGQWAAGVEFSAINQYMSFNGTGYKPKKDTPLPYISLGADPTISPDLANVEPFNDATQEYVKQQIPKMTNLQALSVADMIIGKPTDSPALPHTVGQVWSSGGTSWRVVSISTTMTISDFDPLTDVLFEDFAPAEDSDVTALLSSANDAAISKGKWLISNGGDYKIINFSPSDGTKIKGSSKLSTYTGGMYTGQNMIDRTLMDGFELQGVELDGRNDILSATGADDSFDNIIHFMSSKNVDISKAKFTRAVRHFVWADATETAHTENFKFRKNSVSEGAYDAVCVRRYGDNIRINGNNIKNATNQTKGGDVAAKSISVSGSRNVRIRNNDVADDQGNSSTIIIEYINRPSVDVILEGNSVNGSSSNGIKVGASEDVTLRDNTVENCDSGYYVEGMKRVTLDNNHAKNIQSIAYFVTQDADTGNDNTDVKLLNNTSENANLAGLVVGVPPSSSGDKFSYHMWVENTTKLIVEGNTLSDPGGHVAGGLAINCPYNSIKDNDLSGIHASAVAFYSNFADGSKGKIENNQGMQTTNYGVATMVSGSSQINVIHDVLGTASSTQLSYFNVCPAGALSGSISYWNMQRLDYTTQAIRTRNSSHGAANVLSNTDFVWEMRVTDPKGIYGKTLR